ncbi:hypothetical protein, partial [Algoriphagus chordae]|uniref:hypothetical protein n=1 Tax=Algoriphagus chordae TaxID=237019 RepID=UPI001B85B7DA
FGGQASITIRIKTLIALGSKTRKNPQKVSSITIRIKTRLQKTYVALMLAQKVFPHSFAYRDRLSATIRKALPAYRQKVCVKILPL